MEETRMYNAGGYAAYKKNSVSYASKDQLLIMLLDGAVKFAKLARQGLAENDIKKSHENLIKTQDIFSELMITLDQSAGKWAEDLFNVYDYIKSELTRINIKKDVEAMDKLLPVIENVRDMWNEAYKMSKAQK